MPSSGNGRGLTLLGLVFASAAVRNVVTAVVICMSMLVQADRAKAQVKTLAVLTF